MLIKGIMGSAT